MTKMNVFEIVTQKMIEKLQAGVVPWHKPWSSGVGQPCNLLTGKAYRGINPILLGDTYHSKYWLTFNQVKDMGGHVRAGERASMVVFFKPADLKKKASDSNDTQDENEEKVFRSFILRYYYVFNVCQCEGITHKRLNEESVSLEKLSEFNPIEKCEDIWSRFNNPPKLIHNQQKAFYRPSEDLINMPLKNSFDGEEEYYSTLFHEATHSTGHESRLNRKSVVQSNHFGSKEYSKEELVAEMGAAMLCAHAGIDSAVFDNSAAYIASWLDALKKPNNQRLVVDAASGAQKAVDHILGDSEILEVGE
jgi:antirestriction protein ArdC